MKKILIILPLFALLLVGCTSKPTSTVNLDEFFSLSQGQSVLINGTDLKISYKKFVPAPEFKCSEGDMCLGPQSDNFVLQVNKEEFNVQYYRYNTKSYGDYRIHFNTSQSNSENIVLIVYKNNSCNNISDTVARVSCMIERHDSDSCLTVSDREERQRCLLGFVNSPEASNVKDEAELDKLCAGVNYITTPETCKSQYYTSRAQHSGDFNYCLKSIFPPAVAECIEGLAIQNKDGSLCSKIGDSTQSGTRDDCYWKVVNITKDKSWCDKILYQNTRNNCQEMK